MSQMNREGDNYLTVMAEMDNSWQAAVDKAMSVREEQLSTAHRVIVGLRQQLTERDSLIRIRENEAVSLKLSVTELNSKLDLATKEMALVLENAQRQLEERSTVHIQELEAKERELDETRARHKHSIVELTTGARDTLDDLECQLEAMKAREIIYQQRVVDLEEIKTKQDKHLQHWNKVSEQMCAELSDVKGKLQSSKYANGKLREEMALWKKYCEKIEEERKAIKREIESEKRVLNKLNHFDSYLKTERQQRDMLIDLMNSFGNQMVKDIKQIAPEKVVLKTEESQTDMFVSDDENQNETEKDEIIEGMTQRQMQLEDQLKKTETEVDNLMQQNMTLREVVKSMKKERENREKEMDQIEEEARVTKLEESVRLLKNNLINEQKDVCVWNALQDVKKEVCTLKNRNVLKTVRKEPENAMGAPSAFRVFERSIGK